MNMGTLKRIILLLIAAVIWTIACTNLGAKLFGAQAPQADESTAPAALTDAQKVELYGLIRDVESVDQDLQDQLNALNQQRDQLIEAAKQKRAIAQDKLKSKYDTLPVKKTWRLNRKLEWEKIQPQQTGQPTQ